MPFEKGKSGNPNGRPQGSGNIASRDLRERVLRLLDDQYDNVLNDFQQLNPKERVDAWLRLLEYSLPKLQRTETRDLTTVEELLSMTPDERRERVIYLNSKLG